MVYLSKETKRYRLGYKQDIYCNITTIIRQCRLPATHVLTAPLFSCMIFVHIWRRVFDTAVLVFISTTLTYIADHVSVQRSQHKNCLKAMKTLLYFACHTYTGQKPDIGVRIYNLSRSSGTTQTSATIAYSHVFLPYQVESRSNFWFSTEPHCDVNFEK